MTGRMQVRWNTGQVGCRSVGMTTGGMQDMWNTGQVGCRTGGMQDRWNTGQVRCRTGGMQDWTDAGKEQGWEFAHLFSEQIAYGRSFW